MEAGQNVSLLAGGKIRSKVKVRQSIHQLNFPHSTQSMHKPNLPADEERADMRRLIVSYSSLSLSRLIHRSYVVTACISDVNSYYLPISYVSIFILNFLLFPPFPFILCPTLLPIKQALLPQELRWYPSYPVGLNTSFTCPPHPSPPPMGTVIPFPTAYLRPPSPSLLLCPPIPTPQSRCLLKVSLCITCSLYDSTRCD